MTRLVSPSSFLKQCSFQNRQVHFDVWQNNPTKTISPSSPTVVLFGYAGSPQKNLAKFDQLYAELGYRTISSVLPHKYTYEYDIDSIRACATQVLSRIDNEKADNLVVHTFSNNGVLMYQHLYYLLKEQKRLDVLKGVIMDSGPGPMGWRDNILRNWYTDKQSLTFLTNMLFIVNIANRMGLKENIAMTAKQIINISKNWKNRNVPWAGKFVTHHDQGNWPMMILYSKEDLILPYNYLERLLKLKESQQSNRKILSNCFNGSGHVAHFKRFPAEYRSLIQNFMRTVSN